MAVLKSGITDTGTTEYYLVGFELYDDFEPVLNQLTQMNAKILERLDGIWFQIATVEMGGIAFKVVWHEDVGVYSYVPGEPSESVNGSLQRILEEVVTAINNLG